jgi:DNA-binding IclR family transcriptional regulator
MERVPHCRPDQSIVGVTVTKQKAIKSDRQFIKSSAKLFEMLELYASHGRLHELSLNQVVGELGLPKTTAHRLIYSLEKLGYLERGENAGAFRLGPRFFQLVEGRTSHYRLQMAARPIMKDLSMQIKETINLGILDRDETLLLDVIDGPNAFRWVSKAGERAAFHATALGKAIAAFLPTDKLECMLTNKTLVRLTPHTQVERRLLMRQLRSIQRDFIALDDEESVLGIQCVASPIFDSSMEVIAAVSVTAPKIRLLPQITMAKANVRAAAERISKSLGYQIENKSTA